MTVFPRRRQTDKLLRGLEKGKTQERQNQSGDRNSAVLARVTWDQEPEDSRQHIGREEPSLWSVCVCVGGSPFRNTQVAVFHSTKKLRWKRKLQLL